MFLINNESWKKYNELVEFTISWSYCLLVMVCLAQKIAHSSDAIIFEVICLQELVHHDVNRKSVSSLYGKYVHVIQGNSLPGHAL
jgi:hypothetical protein